MRIVKTILFVLLIALPAALYAQAVPAGGGGFGGGLGEGEIPRAEMRLNYNYLHANAPPGQCGCFSLNRGSAAIVVNLRPRWSAVADITVAHANQVDGTAQNITIIDYLFGPRYTGRRNSRYVPYGQILLGGAKEDVNFQFTINRNSFGVSAGGGVTTRLSPRIGVNIVQLDWIYTQIPNARNNRQNDLRAATGFIYRF